jgi:hypothetical protein
MILIAYLTLFWTLESDKELLPVWNVSNLCNDESETDDWVRTLQHKLARHVCAI